MNTLKGHLTNNGGLRGHSVGDIYPWRVMISGKIDALKYWVVNPSGRPIERFFTSKGAFTRARILKGAA